ncbi:MAG: hypothetical protein BZY80_01300 [SAR202 cluster bacterium Io17-Chloro-G2]|nr:MAG: hypothetical protein BZY80_01300 [SAR202 cluster bacterium Io17-Chloro-G2]
MGISKRRAIGSLMAAASIVFLGVLTAGIVAGQSNTWVRQFGTSFTDKAAAVSVDQSGYIYIAGHTAGRLMDQTRIGGDSDAYVLKVDSLGNPVWARQFGSVGADIAWSVAVGAGGDLFLAGQMAQAPPNRAAVSGFATAFLRKFSSDGTELWARQFGAPGRAWATGVAVDPAGNSYVVGQTEEALPGQTSFGSKDAFIRSYDPNGNERWTRQFGAGGGDFAAAVAADGLGNIFVAGSSGGEITLIGQGHQVTIRPFVRKYRPDGTLVWERRPHIFGFARFLAAAVDSQGGLYVAGWVSGSLSGQTQAGGTDAFVTKINGEGNDIWTHQFGTPKEDRALGIAVDETGASYAVGWTRGLFPGQIGLGEGSLLERRDAFIHKMDSQGNGLWTRQVGTPLAQLANGVVTDGAGSLYVVGETRGPLLGQASQGTVDAFLLKLDAGPAGDTVEVQATAMPTIAESGAVSTVPPTKSNPTNLPPITPISSPTIAPVPEVPGTSACSAPQLGGGPVQLAWFLVTMIPAALAAAGGRSRHGRGSTLDEELP